MPISLHILRESPPSPRQTSLKEYAIAFVPRYLHSDADALLDACTTMATLDTIMARSSIGIHLEYTITIHVNAAIKIVLLLLPRSTEPFACCCIP
jgi:hypothetical protein